MRVRFHHWCMIVDHRVPVILPTSRDVNGGPAEGVDQWEVPDTPLVRRGAGLLPQHAGSLLPSPSSLEERRRSATNLDRCHCLYAVHGAGWILSATVLLPHRSLRRCYPLDWSRTPMRSVYPGGERRSSIIPESRHKLRNIGLASQRIEAYHSTDAYADIPHIHPSLMSVRYNSTLP